MHTPNSFKPYQSDHPEEDQMTILGNDRHREYYATVGSISMQSAYLLHCIAP
jgi:hypothetical protein